MHILKKFIRTILLLGVVAGVVFGGLTLIKRKKQELKKAPEFGLKPRPVTVAQAQKGTLTQKQDYLAVVEPVQTAQVSARVTGTVEKVLCDENDRVKAGDPLVKIDGEEVRHRIDSVSAQIEQAKADLAGNRETIKALESSVKYYKSEAERYRGLAEKDAVPESRAERAEEKHSDIRGKLNAVREKSKAIEHRIASLEQQKKELSEKLSYYTVTSPFNGVVAERRVDVGDMASPGKTLIRMEDRSTLRLAFDVPQDDISAVTAGMSVRFALERERRTAEISVLHPSLNKARMMRAEVPISPKTAEKLPPGAYVPVSVVIDTYKGMTLVPRASLIESPDGGQHVFTLKDGRLKPRSVDVLGFSDNQAAITGVSPGRQVVCNTFLGWARLSSGEKVEAIQ